MKLSRRRALSLFASAAAAATASSRVISASAQNADRHGMSAFGDLKYPPDFPHF
jgi:microcin C transport system substrate-binding protein